MACGFALIAEKAFSSPNTKIYIVAHDAACTSNSQVMINGRNYRVGDRMRGHADHLITDITSDSVTIRVRNSRGDNTYQIEQVSRYDDELATRTKAMDWTTSRVIRWNQGHWENYSN